MDSKPPLRPFWPQMWWGRNTQSENMPVFRRMATVCCCCCCHVTFDPPRLKKTRFARNHAIRRILSFVSCRITWSLPHFCGCALFTILHPGSSNASLFWSYEPWIFWTLAMNRRLQPLFRIVLSSIVDVPSNVGLQLWPRNISFPYMFYYIFLPVSFRFFFWKKEFPKQNISHFADSFLWCLIFFFLRIFQMLFSHLVPGFIGKSFCFHGGRWLLTTLSFFWEPNDEPTQRMIIKWKAVVQKKSVVRRNDRSFAVYKKKLFPHIPRFQYQSFV